MGFNFFFAALEAFPGVLSAHAGGEFHENGRGHSISAGPGQNAPSFIVIEAMAGSGRWRVFWPDGHRTCSSVMDSPGASVTRIAAAF